MDLPPLQLTRVVGELALVFGLAFAAVCAFTMYARTRPAAPPAASPLEEGLRSALAAMQSWCLLLVAPMDASAPEEWIALEKLTRGALRKTDFAGVHEDRCVAVIAATELPGALRIAARLSALTEAKPVCIGLASHPPDGKNAAELIATATARLNESLQRGRAGTGIAPATVRAADADAGPILSFAAFTRELGKIIVSRRRAGNIVSLLHVGIDQFQTYAHQYGKNVADDLVRETADIARRQLRRGDIAAEAEGGSLVVVLPASPAQARDVATRLVAAARRPIFAAKGGNAKLTVSIGVACVPQHAGSAVALLDASSIAMNVAKGRGGNSVVLFERDMPVTGTAEAPRDVF